MKVEIWARSPAPVQEDARRARRLGAAGAPFIVVASRYGVPGALTSAGDAPGCGPDGRAVPARP